MKERDAEALSLLVRLEDSLSAWYYGEDSCGCFQFPALSSSDQQVLIRSSSREILLCCANPALGSTSDSLTSRWGITRDNEV